jgi:hypothetical protein
VVGGECVAPTDQISNRARNELVVFIQFFAVSLICELQLLYEIDGKRCCCCLLTSNYLSDSTSSIKVNRKITAF